MSKATGKRNTGKEDALRKLGFAPGIGMRSAHVRAIAEKEDDPIVWTLATEQPVMIFDWLTWDYWPEVLLMDGMVSPAVKQVPLLDSHQRFSVKSILGSVRDFAVVDGGEYSAVEGKAYFSSVEYAQEALTKVREGHLTDGSVGYGYSDTSVVYVGEDQEVEIKGKSFVGPVKVITEWQLLEFSPCPIGADSLAKAKDIISGDQ